MANVLIPTPLRAVTGNEAQVQVAGATVGEALAALCEQFPDLRDKLYGDDGKVRRFVNVFVDGEDIRYSDGESTVVTEGSEIAIVPAIAGG